MKFSFLEHVLCLFIIGMMLASCSKDELGLKTNALTSDAQENAFVSESQKEIITDYLGDKGYCGDIFFGERGAFYGECDYAGCAVHKRYSDLEDEINNSLKNSSAGSEKKARFFDFNSYHHYPTNSKLKLGFKYFVDYAGCTHCRDIWEPYIIRAFRYFEQSRRPYSSPNQVPFTSVHFKPIRRGQTPDLTIKFADFGPDPSSGEVYFGVAESPLNGKCGPYLYLQSNINKLPERTESFHHTVLHELMHTIGFAHSNFDYHTSLSVPGTAAQDDNSIMISTGINEQDATMFFQRMI